MMEPAALYLRLSQEDGERWGESQSISNQRIFLINIIFFDSNLKLINPDCQKIDNQDLSF